MSIFEDFEIEIPLKHRVKFREIISAYDAIVDDNADLKAKYEKAVNKIKNIAKQDPCNCYECDGGEWIIDMAISALAELGEK